MPISDCEVRDPRIRRTRQLLQGALRELLQERSFDEVSVQEIADRATVNRATFYDHYNDKYALLEAMVAGQFHNLLHERNVRFDSGCPAAAAAIIQAGCDHMLQAHHGGDCSKMSAFAPLIDAAMMKAVRNVLLAGRSDAPLDGKLAATAASCAICGSIKEWFYTPDRPPVADAVARILDLVLPILQQIGPPTEQPPQASCAAAELSASSS